eukprot:435284-Rhodomonas_salina.2
MRAPHSERVGQYRTWHSGRVGRGCVSSGQRGGGDQRLSQPRPPTPSRCLLEAGERKALIQRGPQVRGAGCTDVVPLEVEEGEGAEVWERARHARGSLRADAVLVQSERRQQRAPLQRLHQRRCSLLLDHVPAQVEVRQRCAVPQVARKHLGSFRPDVVVRKDQVSQLLAFSDRGRQQSDASCTNVIPT